MKQRREFLRNVAIVAHVDHGKTTLVDALLRQCRVFRDNQDMGVCVMDSGDLERERGITILAKNASVRYRGVKINLIDTPGHADFGGEVERVLNMADGILLVVDACEGPMPQTRFVLQKALAAQLAPLVVVNKIDRPGARPVGALDEVLELFMELGANDSQLDFPVVYASGRDGYAKRRLDDESVDCRPLLDAILGCLPAPLADPDAPAQMQVTAIDYNDYVGRVAVGRVHQGTLRERSEIVVLDRRGGSRRGRVETLRLFEGIGRQAAKEVAAGDICVAAGVPDVEIYDTFADPAHPEALPAPTIEEPTLTMEFRANDSPFLGRDGKYVTSRHLKERLDRELRSNIALRVEPSRDGYRVSGRGLLHLGILIETMRREGFEFSVGRPRVIYREENGQRLEPVEWLSVDVSAEYAGKAMELVGARRGLLQKQETRGGSIHYTFLVPSRGLIGLRPRLLTAARGEAAMHHVVSGYEPFRGEVPGRANGVLISAAQGRSTAYALDALQLRGVFFIHPQTEVYEGMIVGENNRPDDLEVNVCREKKLTNVRASGSHDKNAELTPPREMSLEACLEYLEDDELLEVTPKSLRLRKTVLRDSDRRRRERLAVRGD